MEEYVSFIEQNWPLTNVRIGESLKEAAGIRTVRRLDANEGTFICKVADSYKTTEELSHNLLAFDRLPEAGFTHIPALIQTKEGKLYQKYQDQYTYILEYIEGKNPDPTPANYRKLGLITAQLHAIKGYPYETEFRPANIISNDLPTLVEGRPFNDEYLKLVKSLPRFDNLPQALIHTDIAPINSIERPNGEVVLVDWDDIGMGVRVLDIAFPLIQQFISEDCDYDEASAKAFYGAYLSKISLTPEELIHVFPAALFIALMYIIYGDTDRRWKRIQWAIANREMLERNLTICSVQLTDGVITLRPMTLEDAEDHLAGDDDEQVKWLNDGKGSTLEGVQNWILKNQEHWQNDGPVFNFGIRDKEDRLVGMIDANTDFENLEGVERGDANISYSLYPQARGKGYMARAVTLLERFLAEKDIKHGVIRVSPENVASLAVPARLGYEDRGEITTKDGERLRVFGKELAHPNKNEGVSN